MYAPSMASKSQTQPIKLRRVLPPRADALRFVRLLKGLTQEQLAGRLGVSRQWVLRREGGKSPIKNIEIPSIEMACGVDSGTFAECECRYRQEDAARAEAEVVRRKVS